MNKIPEYVDMIKKGDELSFRYFVDIFSKDLFYYAQCIIRSKELAEEIVGDVFFDVWSNRDKLDEIQNIKAWLVTLTHNKSISYLRKEDNMGTLVSWDEIEDFSIVGNLQSPDEQVISKEEMAEINRIIQSLPPKCKIVFVLAKIERLPYKEIAKILNISVKTINVHIAKALSLISEGIKNKN